MTRWSKALSLMRIRCPAIKRTNNKEHFNSLRSSRRLLAGLFQNDTQDTGRHLLESQRLHRIGRASLRQRPNGSGVAEHCGQRHMRVKYRLSAFGVNANYCAAPAVDA